MAYILSFARKFNVALSDHMVWYFFANIALINDLVLVRSLPITWTDAWLQSINWTLTGTTSVEFEQHTPYLVQLICLFRLQSVDHLVSVRYDKKA